jgi:hypothetical protein
MQETEIVSKVNELFHLQQDKDWEQKSRQIVLEFGNLRYYEGQRTALQNLIGNIDADTDELLANKLEKIEAMIEIYSE